MGRLTRQRPECVLVPGRAEDGSFVLIVCNFTPVARSPYRVGVPIPGGYREVVNSDAWVYGGSNIGNFGGVLAEQHPSHGRPYSLNLTLPPLSTLILRPK